MSESAAVLETKPIELVRVYADISADVELKLRMRTLLAQRESGVKMTRKQYLEKLINDDAAKVNGASVREVTRRKLVR